MKINKIAQTVDLILKVVSVSMGVLITVLSLTGSLETKAAIQLLGIWLAFLVITQFSDK